MKNMTKNDFKEKSSSMDKNLKKFFHVFILSSLAYILILFAVGIYFNPYEVFPVNHFEPVKPCTRRLKMKLMDDIDYKPSVLILGTSRVLDFDSRLVDDLSGGKSFNAGVFAGRTEDFYVLFRYLLDEKKINPQMVIMGLDVESFHSTIKNSESFLPFEPLLIKYLDLEDKPAFVYEQLSTVLDVRYQRACFVALIRSIFGDKAKTNISEKTQWGFKPQGYGYNLYAAGLKEKGELNPSGSSWKLSVASTRRMYSDFSNISKMRKKYLEKIVSICKHKNISLVVFITTSHPELNKLLGKDREKADRLYADLKYYVGKLSWEYGFKFYDFSRIEDFGGDINGFLDMTHVDQENSDRIIKIIFRDRILK